MDAREKPWLVQTPGHSVLDVPLPAEEFARRLRELREQHDPPMNQEEAARFLDINTRHYTRMETAKISRPHIATLQKIADRYRVPVDRLIVETVPPARLTDDDLRRIEAKLDAVLELVAALAGTDPQTALADAAAAITAALQAADQRSATPPPADADTTPPAQAAGRRRRAPSPKTR